MAMVLITDCLDKEIFSPIIKYYIELTFVHNLGTTTI